MMAEALGPMSGSRQVAVSLDGRVPGPSAEWFRISSFVLPPPPPPGPQGEQPARVPPPRPHHEVPPERPGPLADFSIQ